MLKRLSDILSIRKSISRSFRPERRVYIGIKISNIELRPSSWVVKTIRISRRVSFILNSAVILLILILQVWLIKDVVLSDGSLILLLLLQLALYLHLSHTACIIR
jgi:hypothetical protein